MRISDARLREQARKSTTSCVLNIAEGAGRRSRADKSRVYAIALGEGPARPSVLRQQNVRSRLPVPEPDSRRTTTEHGALPKGAGKNRCTEAEGEQTVGVAVPVTLGGDGNGEPVKIPVPEY